MQENEVKEKIEKALITLTEEDSYLLEHDLSERCIAHRLAIHLSEFFSGLDIDIEYNRDDTMKKCVRVPDEEEFKDTSVYPDIIIHKRSTSNNLIAIEIKKSTNKSKKARGFDIQKLKAYKTDLHYKHAVMLDIETKGVSASKAITFIGNTESSQAISA